MAKEPVDMTLAELCHLQHIVQGYIVLRVGQSRREGMTWAQIAVGLGVTRQEAHRRYSWLDKLSQAQASDNDGGATR